MTRSRMDWITIILTAAATGVILANLPVPFTAPRPVRVRQDKGRRPERSDRSARP